MNTNNVRNLHSCSNIEKCSPGVLLILISCGMSITTLSLLLLHKTFGDRPSGSAKPPKHQSHVASACQAVKARHCYHHVFSWSPCQNHAGTSNELIVAFWFWKGFKRCLYRHQCPPKQTNTMIIKYVRRHFSSVDAWNHLFQFPKIYLQVLGDWEVYKNSVSLASGIKGKFHPEEGRAL